MVITTDFNIFADKYHNSQHLPNDLIQMIMEINTKEIKEEKENYRKFNEVVEVMNDLNVYVLETIEEIEEIDDNSCIYLMIIALEENGNDEFNTTPPTPNWRRGLEEGWLV
jgi:hypothetical protein